MSLLETIAKVKTYLQAHGRVSFRVLELEFELSDDQIQALVEELVDVQQVAAREGKVLSWMGAAPAEVPATETQTQVASAAPTAEAERRQLTVLFCDLVDSTRLAAGMDPEDWREMVRGYQEAAGAVIERFEGHVAQYLGDGLLVYFGYPRAHEDDAERAVRAGLGIVDALGEGDERLAVRIGIHTGPVVVGEMGGGASRETLAMGDTTNVAARLQGIAEPNTVVMSAATLRLTPGVFVTRDLGAQRLKGFDEPVLAHQAVQPSGVRSRLDVLAAAELTPFVGRDQELGLLGDRFAQVAEGRGQVVLICGEAGIGKSRLMQAFREQLAERPHSWLECRGSPYTQDSALYPVLEVLRQGLGFRSEDAPERKLEALQTGLATMDFDLNEAVPLLATLHTVPLGERYATPNLSPEGMRKKTLALLTEWVLRLGLRQPLVVLMEDLHWMDPSTLELLGQILEQVPTVPVLLLATYRPDFEPPWGARSHVTPMLLSRMTQSQLGDLVRKTARGRDLPESWVAEILRRSDGVPLFAEELTRAVVETHPEPPEGGATPELHIPDTLQDSLMSRLDQLGPVKELAQVGAVLGREFSYDLLLKVSPMTEAELVPALQAAVREELFYRRGAPPDATYLFKHALIRDAAYQSLLRSTRQRHPARVAKTLIDRMPGVTNAQPELVAHHLSEAGDTETAIRWWRRAGEQAFSRVAAEEALRHIERGVALLEDLPEGPWRDEQEIRLQVLRARTASVARGFGVDDTLLAWERARDLCDPDADPLLAGVIYYGLSTTAMSRGQFRAALDTTAEVFRAAERSRDPLLEFAAPHGRAAMLLCMGEFARSCRDFERANALFDPAVHRFIEAGHQEEHGIQSFSWGAWSYHHAGFPERARVAAEHGIELARRRGHLYTLAFTLNFAGWTHVLRRDPGTARARASEGARLAADQGFTLMEGVGRLVVAWADGIVGAADGLERYATAMTLASSAGNQVGVPLILNALAELQVAAGQLDVAVGTVTGALAFAEQTEQHFRDAELQRLKGEIFLQMEDPTEGEAEALFEKAIEIAREQEAKSLELRAATSLARLWQRQCKLTEARDLLQPIYDWFTEGFDTQDLRDAKALLEELA